MFQQWLDLVIKPLIASKRANAAVASAIFGVLVHVGMAHLQFSQNTATAIAMAIFAIGGIFIHSQGSADRGKEALKVLLSTDEGKALIQKMENPLIAGVSPFTEVFPFTGVTPLQNSDRVKPMYDDLQRPVFPPEAPSSQPIAPSLNVEGARIDVNDHTEVVITPSANPVLLPKTTSTRFKWMEWAVKHAPGGLAALLDTVPAEIRVRLHQIGFPGKAGSNEQAEWVKTVVSQGEDRFAAVMRQAGPAALASFDEVLAAIGRAAKFDLGNVNIPPVKPS